ncbi:MAG: phosphate ABC transporter substrate-binding protein [Patescibacteria group bacterium]
MKRTVGLAVLVLALALGAALVLAPAGAALSGSISIVGSTSVQPLAEELARAFMAKNPGVNVTVAGGGSSAGIKAVLTGAADIGASSRELKPGEEAALTATVIARDGIAVIVNKSNKVSKLTLEQIYRMYTGKVRNWKEVGGAASPIVLIGRDAASGTRGAFEELVYRVFDKKAASSPAMLQQGSTGTIRQIVATNRFAVGYISLGALDKSVKAVMIDNVAANAANVMNKTYKISRPFIFATKGAPRGLAKSFIAYILSPAGQAVVAREFVSVGKTK